jgi:hypothetical protein
MKRSGILLLVLWSSLALLSFQEIPQLHCLIHAATPSAVGRRRNMTEQEKKREIERWQNMTEEEREREFAKRRAQRKLERDQRRKEFNKLREKHKLEHEQRKKSGTKKRRKVFFMRSMHSE